MLFMRSIVYSIIVTTCAIASVGLFLSPQNIYAADAAAWWSSSGPCKKWEIELNTDFPFLGRCIGKDVTSNGTNVANAFPYLMGVLVRVTMTIILVAGVLLIIGGGLMMTLQGSMGTASQWKELIMKVIIGLAVLGTSAIVLNLINPNFFGTES